MVERSRACRLPPVVARCEHAPDGARRGRDTARTRPRAPASRRGSLARASCSATARAEEWARPTSVAVTALAVARQLSVALVEQPYRVAGPALARRPPARLDAAWTAVVAHLAAGPLHGAPLITGGRSSGARVACRTASATGAAGVLCLAFPLQPASRPGAAPRPSRLPELEAVECRCSSCRASATRSGCPPRPRGARSPASRATTP